MSKALLAEAKWYPYWDREDGACPACVQQNLLQTLLAKGDAALHEAIQTAWPLDAEAAFGVLPTRLRLHADPRFSGKGIVIALVANWHLTRRHQRSPSGSTMDWPLSNSMKTGRTDRSKLGRLIWIRCCAGWWDAMKGMHYAG